MPDDRTVLQRLQSGSALYTPLNQRKGIQRGQQPVAAATTQGYRDYKSGNLTDVGVQSGFGGYRDPTLAQQHFDFTKRYNEDPAYRASVVEDRRDKSGLTGALSSLVKPAKSHLSQALSAVKDDPRQALLGGMTPVGAELWNNVAGTDFTPQTTLTGGATDEQIAQMESEGINTENFQNMNSIADTVAMFYAGQWAGNALGGSEVAGGGTGGGGGGGPYTGSGGANAFNNPSSSFYSAPSGGANLNASPGLWDSIKSLGGNSLNSSSGGSDMYNWLNLGSSLGSAYLTNQATEAGMDQISDQYDQTRADMEPWRLAGIRGLSQYEGALNQPVPNFEFNLEDDPVYQFQRDEALRATERAMAARGYNGSGNMLRELQRTAAGEAGRYQDQAYRRQLGESQTNYGREFDRANQYANLAGLGQSSTNALAGLGAGAASNLANLHMQQGQGYNNALQGFLSNYTLNNYLNRGY